MAERILPFELIAAAAAFALLIRRRATTTTGRIELGRAISFGSALGVLAFALLGRIDSESGRALSWHMVQHLLIVSIAAPLIALARPVELVLDSLPRRLVVVRHPGWRGTLGTTTAGFIALSTLLAWHIPTLYQAALSSEMVHIVEHVTLLASSTVLWSALIGTRRLGASVVWLFVFTFPITAFGVAMTIASTPWYADYVTRGRSNAVHDQQLAGVIMWAFGGLAALAGGVVLFASWLMSASSTTTNPRPLVSPADSAPTC